MGRDARLVIVLTHDPHRVPRLGYSRGVNLRDVVIALSWLGRGDYVAADWEEAPKPVTTPPRLTVFSGEARKRIVAATSSTLGQASKLALGMSRRLVGVSMIEGATAFTRIPSPASSSPSAAESAATPALAAVEALIRPGARLQGLARRHVDDTPTGLPPAHCRHRFAAAEEAAHEIVVDQPTQQLPAGIGQRGEGEAAGDMDRGPERREPAIELRHRRLIRQARHGDQAQRPAGEGFLLSLLPIGHMAMGARRQHCTHHRAPQGAGAAGYHHVTIAKIHPTLGPSAVIRAHGPVRF